MAIFLRAFTREADAKEFFENKVVENSTVVGVLASHADDIWFRKDSDGTERLSGGERLFLVITYPAGAEIRIDARPAD
ncbi:hypothetical protein [Novosphingobium album (ex Liu et al. 2023)]|uniref:Uncharacterized protein n=1 Tax=Novosphingobium album (ex Liu et al. 2023) TaxID=3031130 RepID=A0ABT5WN01_9SPHN|nr:hypothetical protein [Novosphingobium album (ex Liu et al. 2023)]MDE8650308.1 hypothetical protein [Novosphingobium album (ex Liu et al. 2023)]